PPPSPPPPPPPRHYPRGYHRMHYRPYRTAPKYYYTHRHHGHAMAHGSRPLRYKY
ncbi:MAG TPA: aminoglycoside phosphotransferase, partial [Afipia sp.]|nr:aminoglycoside phosphotransferase [Afipia sp.]